MKYMHIVRVGGWGVTFSKEVFIVAFYSEETVVKRLCKKKICTSSIVNRL